MKKEDYKYSNGERMYSADTRGMGPTYSVLGKTILGEPYGLAVSDAPNILIAGTLASGKTEMIHTMLSYMISNSTPQELGIYIADMKGVEYLIYEDSPHLRRNPVDNPKETSSMLKGLIEIMNKRQSLLDTVSEENIFSYNDSINYSKNDYLSEIVVIIDDYAYLAQEKIGVKEDVIIDDIIELAGNGKRVGIHLVLSTPTLSEKVVTKKLLKVFPTRILRGDITRIDQYNGRVAELIGDMDKRSLAIVAHNGDISKVDTVFVKHSEKIDVINNVKDKYPESTLSNNKDRVSLSNLIKGLFE